MSKRKNRSSTAKPNKRVRAVEEEEDDDTDDSDHEGQRPFSQCSGEVMSDVGIVKSITLQNFMCHTNFELQFGSNVNFVVGNNGSGKSAILTGLIVALGGTAQATNRGLSLKGFVKEGESSAFVSVTLNNKGRDAYKPEVYGESIILDQRITREGLRTYKLKSHSGHVISTKKEDLVAILDNFNIQVNNPVTILTQEMSKHFLHSKGEEEKYKFFMKASQLGQMKDDFVYIKKTHSVTDDKIRQYSECVKELKKDYLEKENRYKSLASVNEMHTKLEQLKRQMAWALVAELEKELQPMKEKLEVDRQGIDKFNDKVEEWEKKLDVAEGKQKQSQEQLEGITQQVKDIQSKCIVLKAEVQKNYSNLKSSEVTVHRHKANIRDLEKDKAQLTSRIHDLSLIINQGNGAESKARAERIAQIEAELDHLKHHTSTLGQQIEQYQHACYHATEEQGKLMRENDGLQRSIDKNRRHLQSMESCRSNRLQRFGVYMPALLTAIEEAHKRGQFKHKPRGPLGYLITLKDPELALPIEICLKNLLQSFTCDNYDDERVLKGLMAKVCQGKRPTVITSRFLPKLHDTRRRAVNHPKYPSVLQALEIEDPVVANCLIDQRAIERILLIKDRTEARRVMQGKNPPQNCIQAYSKDGDQILSSRNYSADQTQAKFLSKDVEDGIRHLQREIENQKGQADNIQRQIRRLDEDIRRNKDLLKRTHAEQKTTKDKTIKLQLEITDLRNVEEPQSEDLKPLEEDLQEIITKITAKRVECDEAQAQMAELKDTYEKAEKEYKQHKELINTAVEEADVKKEELSKTDKDVMKCKHHKIHYEDKRSTYLCSLQTLENKVAGKEEELQESIAKAKEICPEQLEVRRTARSLDTEISRLKANIETQKEHQGDREEIVRQYHEAVESYKSKTQEIKYLENFTNCLNDVMAQRVKAYMILRGYLSARCKYCFNSMLDQRGYNGNMKFDHNKETLSISVQPGQGNKAELNDMRSLSGGERSFSTVCFVLSLWPITEAPFRCLDEFDVYMDMVNRKISVDMMLKLAKSQRNRQFIFLTPQTMSFVKASEYVEILGMNDQRPCQDQTEQGEGESRRLAV